MWTGTYNTDLENIKGNFTLGKIPKLPHALGIFPMNHFHVEMNQSQIGHIKLQIEYSKKEKN